MTDIDESLVGRRSRRSTAGNRMEAALAELALEDLSKDAEDDIDFAVEKDEEDIFGSDFESTDEEFTQEDVDAGERTAQDEEKRERKAARSRVDKATAAAHARQKVTFNPQAIASSSKERPVVKPKRRVSLGVATNAETGEVIEGSKRQSRRKHTVLNTSATASRMKDAEEKRASVPKKTKVETRTLTQGELIARALDTEEGNIVEHRDYLKLEDEKRKRARVVRATIEGPLIRWISKGQDVKVTVDPVPPIASYSYAHGHDAPTASGASTPSQPAEPYQHYYHSPGTNQQPGPYPILMNCPSASVPSTPGKSEFSSQPSAAATSYTHVPFPPPPPLPPVERTEKVTKNYVVHELSQLENVPKPQWGDTMEAMFGGHVKWEELRVFVGKGRPLVRPKQMCPLTGRPARYLDPRSGVPFADVRSYETLTKILAHEYEWSDELGCYVSCEGVDGDHCSSNEPPRKRPKPDRRVTSKVQTEGIMEIS